MPMSPTTFRSFLGEILLRVPIVVRRVVRPALRSRIEPRSVENEVIAELIDLVEVREGFRGETMGQAVNWIKRATITAVRRRLAHDRRQFSLCDGFAEGYEPMDGRTPEALLGAEQQVEAGLARLPKHERVVARLALRDGFDLREIAGKLGRGYGWVACQLRKARARLVRQGKA